MRARCAARGDDGGAHTAQDTSARPNARRSARTRSHRTARTLVVAVVVHGEAIVHKPARVALAAPRERNLQRSSSHRIQVKTEATAQTDTGLTSCARSTARMALVTKPLRSLSKLHVHYTNRKRMGEQHGGKGARVNTQAPTSSSSGGVKAVLFFFSGRMKSAYGTRPANTDSQVG